MPAWIYVRTERASYLRNNVVHKNGLQQKPASAHRRLERTCFPCSNKMYHSHGRQAQRWLAEPKESESATTSSRILMITPRSSTCLNIKVSSLQDSDLCSDPIKFLLNPCHNHFIGQTKRNAWLETSLWVLPADVLPVR